MYNDHAQESQVKKFLTQTNVYKRIKSHTIRLKIVVPNILTINPK